METINKLSDLCSGSRKHIYCFGAGKLFDSFMKEFSSVGFENNIKAIVDNKVDSIILSEKMINNISIPIIPLNQMLNDIEDDDCILITTLMYEEVIEQIKRIGMLENTPYFIYPIMKIDYYDSDRLKGEIPLKLSTYKDIQIPKVIHYCWFGRKEKPLRYKKWMESWKYYCPDYEIVEWNENNYDVYKNKYIAQAYEMQKWAFVSDYARVDIISQYGGIYLDTDVELIKNIDELLMNDAFCGFESRQFVAYGLGFGAKKSHPIVSEIKKYYDGIDFILENGTLNQITCPVIQTEVMKRYGLICNGRFQVVDGMAVYPPRILCGMSPHSFRVVRDLSRTYAIHHFEGSWTDRERKNQLIPALKRWSKNTDYIYPDD